MDKIHETVSVIEESKIEACQEKLVEGKKIILKQEKLLAITDSEEDGLEVVKCYMLDDISSDSDDITQISRASREAATNRKKRRKISKKIKINSFGMIISRLSICYLAILISKYIRSIVNSFVLNGPMKRGLQNISNHLLYDSVCYKHVTFSQRFYPHLLSVGEVSAVMLFILMAVLQYFVVSSLPKQRAYLSKII